MYMVYTDDYHVHAIYIFHIYHIYAMYTWNIYGIIRFIWYIYNTYNITWIPGGRARRRGGERRSTLALPPRIPLTLALGGIYTYIYHIYTYIYIWFIHIYTSYTPCVYHTCTICIPYKCHIYIPSRKVRRRGGARRSTLALPPRS